MIQARTKGIPRLGMPRASRGQDLDWSEQLSILLGMCEEYQSSAIGVARLRAAIHGEQGLDAVLRPSLAEMREANEALRREILSRLDGLADVIEGKTSGIDGAR